MFQRFAGHLRQQNWFAVGLEFVVLVMGIFIGLQVTDWNQQRLDRKTEVKYLEALNIDLESTADAIAESMDRYRMMEQALFELAALDEGRLGEYTAEQLDTLVLHGLWYMEYLEVQMPVWDELVSSGQTSILGSQQIRRRLALLEIAIERYRNTERDGAQVQYRNTDPHLASHFPMRRFQPMEPSAAGLPPPLGIAPPDYLEFVSDMQTQNRISMKFMFVDTALDRLVDLDEEIREVQGLVSERLRELGASQS